jgi:hypothetical protein
MSEKKKKKRKDSLIQDVQDLVFKWWFKETHVSLWKREKTH